MCANVPPRRGLGLRLAIAVTPRPLECGTRAAHPPRRSALSPTRLARSIVGLWLLALASGAAQTSGAASYHAVGPYRFKDFSVVHHQGLFHVYAIHECISPGQPDCDTTRRGFMHLTSPDLTHWTEVGFVLPPDARSWRSYDVWAPSIVERDGTYSMFYTAVEREPGGLLVQRISVATSTDLYAWTDSRETPLFAGDLFEWAYWDLSSTDGIGADCRDPFVTWDASRQQWVMLLSLRMAYDEMLAPQLFQPMVIGVAASPDLEHWTAVARLDDTKGYRAESAHLIEHDGMSWLFWTADSITSASGTDPIGPFTNVGPPAGMPSAGFASEALRVDGQDFIMYAMSPPNTLEFGQLDWSAADVALGPIAYGTVDAQVWNDDDANGIRDAREPGLDGVTVEVLRDDGDGLFTPGGEIPYATLVTKDVAAPPIETGLGRLATALPGRYFVRVDSSAFGTGGLLAGLMPGPVRTLDIASDQTVAAPFGLANASGVGQPPSVPEAISPADGQSLPTTTAMLRFSASDPEGDSLVYDLQIDQVPSFDSSELRLARSRGSPGGWSGAGGPWQFASGEPAAYSARRLHNGLYYWRVRAIDPLGSGGFSDFSPVRSFSTPPPLTLSLPTVSCPAADSATIEWRSSNPGSSNIWYRDEHNQLSFPGPATTHRFDLGELTPSTTYPFAVWTVDGYGQVAVSDVGSFTTPALTTGITPAALSPGIALAPPSPNPSSRGALLRFDLARPSAASLVLCDVHGRRVARWAWPALEAGPHQVEWDGRAEGGGPAPAGILFCRLVVGGQTHTQKLVHLR